MTIIWYNIILYYVMLCYVTLCYVMLCYIILCYIILYIRDPYSSAEANLLCCVEASRTGGTFCSAFSGPKNVGFTARSHQAPLLDRPGSRDGTPMYTGSTGSTCVAWNRWSTVGTLVVCVYGESRWGDLIVMPDKGPTKRALPHAEPSFSSGRTVGASSLSHPAAWHRSIPSRVCLDNWTSESTASGMFWKTGPIGFGRNTIQSCCFNVTLLFI